MSKKLNNIVFLQAMRFRKVGESVNKDTKWHFNAFNEEDIKRINLLKQAIGISEFGSE